MTFTYGIGGSGSQSRDWVAVIWSFHSVRALQPLSWAVSCRVKPWWERESGTMQVFCRESAPHSLPRRTAWFGRVCGMAFLRGVKGSRTEDEEYWEVPSNAHEVTRDGRFAGGSWNSGTPGSMGPGNMDPTVDDQGIVPGSVGNNVMDGRARIAAFSLVPTATRSSKLRVHVGQSFGRIKREPSGLREHCDFGPRNTGGVGAGVGCGGITLGWQPGSPAQTTVGGRIRLSRGVGHCWVWVRKALSKTHVRVDPTAPSWNATCSFLRASLCPTTLSHHPPGCPAFAPRFHTGRHALHLTLSAQASILLAHIATLFSVPVDAARCTQNPDHLRMPSDDPTRGQVGKGEQDGSCGVRCCDLGALFGGLSGGVGGERQADDEIKTHLGIGKWTHPRCGMKPVNASQPSRGTGGAPSFVNFCSLLPAGPSVLDLGPNVSVSLFRLPAQSLSPLSLYVAQLAQLLPFARAVGTTMTKRSTEHPRELACRRTSVGSLLEQDDVFGKATKLENGATNRTVSDLAGGEEMEMLEYLARRKGMVDLGGNVPCSFRTGVSAVKMLLSFSLVVAGMREQAVPGTSKADPVRAMAATAKRIACFSLWRGASGGMGWEFAERNRSEKVTRMVFRREITKPRLQRWAKGKLGKGKAGQMATWSAERRCRPPRFGDLQRLNGRVGGMRGLEGVESGRIPRCSTEAWIGHMLSLLIGRKRQSGRVDGSAVGGSGSAKTALGKDKDLPPGGKLDKAAEATGTKQNDPQCKENGVEFVPVSAGAAGYFV
ncbi:hypothetical protein M427DRAFT_47738 [Gonapodya prolifera JEL478]|uniref:Uncharacterized protein n=1 Tax=Gonapodya prolifera (strain JEL478) TaxID=1344416 RepID=A0A139A1U1_GONPJ|nr:hypothetical protein M427DRAFT_47738 [Gonapodya prolifera JEL478]|eukprot:KXS10760.1 hypothetical protein M427DRAFT_47738 [Gonapodya prolifera JEL478]